jgi:predicted metal-binding protein
MRDEVKIGIIICDRYHTCAGGKCIRALKNREGAFSRYQGQDVELVGYTTCGGCPGGNIEVAPVEMKNVSVHGGRGKREGKGCFVK